MIKVAFQINDKTFVQLIVYLIATYSSGTHIAMQNGHFNLDHFFSSNVEMQCSRAASVHVSGSRFQGPQCCLHPFCVPSLFNENYITTMNTWKDTLRSLKPNDSSARSHAMGAPDSCITNDMGQFIFFLVSSTPSLCNPS